MVCSMRRRVVLQVEYIGTEFRGWERKPGLRTVQGTIEKTVNDVVGEVCRTVAASKTDAGTHAIGQVLHFDTEKRMTAYRAWEKAINPRLPRDITVARSGVCGLDRFDARSDAIWRRYKYTIFTSRLPPSIFLSPYVWHYYHHELDVDAMNAAAALLKSSDSPRDMSTFRKARSAARHTDITCFHASVRRASTDMIEVDVTATWFVYGMMRFLTAALVQVGNGTCSVERFGEVVRAGDRSFWKHSAPASGLCLVEVGYKAGHCPLIETETLYCSRNLGLPDLHYRACSRDEYRP